MELLPNWLQEQLPAITFKLVSDKEMLSLGGVGEQIACTVDTCYVTHTFLNYPMTLQRALFFLDYLTMLEYGAGQSSGFLNNLQFVPQSRIRSVIDLGLPLKETRKIFFNPEKWKINKHLLNIDFIIFDLANTPNFHDLLPKATFQKARLVATSLRFHTNSVLGNAHIILDTPQICVMRVTFNYTLSHQPLNLITGDLEKVYYYHYASKRFLGRQTTIGKEFTSRNAVILQLLE